VVAHLPRHARSVQLLWIVLVASGLMLARGGPPAGFLYSKGAHVVLHARGAGGGVPPAVSARIQNIAHRSVPVVPWAPVLRLRMPPSALLAELAAPMRGMQRRLEYTAHAAGENMAEAETSTRRKKKQGKKSRPEEKEVRAAIVGCIKTRDMDAAVAAFEGAVKRGVSVPAEVLEMLVRLASDTGRREEGARFLALLKPLKQPSEAVYANLIREAAEAPRGGAPDLELALTLFGECVEGCPVLRLRTVEPLLAGLLRAGRVADAMAAWRRTLASQPDVLEAASSSDIGPVEQVLVSLLVACASSPHTPPSDALHVLSVLASACLGVSRASADALLAAFPALAEIVAVDADGVCAATGASLHRPALSADECAHVHAGLLAAAASGAGREQVDRLREFAAWLAERPGGGVTAVVDGPNVAYARQNVQDGQFSFHQVDEVLRALEALGHAPLLLLPSKYLGSTVPNHSRWKGVDRRTDHDVTPEERAIVERWHAQGLVYPTPRYANDDWCPAPPQPAPARPCAAPARQTERGAGRGRYWMMATVTRGAGQAAPPVVVSNDQMRDHRLALLDTRPFTRWKAQQVMRFDFSHAYHVAGVANGTTDVPTLSLVPPRRFSVEIYEAPLAGEGGAARAGERVFYIPVLGTPEQEALGLRTPAAVASRADWHCAAPARLEGADAELLPGEGKGEDEGQDALGSGELAWLCLRLPA